MTLFDMPDTHISYRSLIIKLEWLYRLSDEYHNSKEAIRVMRDAIVKGQPIFTSASNIEV